MIGVKDQQDLLLSIARNLRSPIECYAVGGTAMMFHTFKDVTRDIDLVFLNEHMKIEFMKSAQSLDYQRISSATVYGTKDNQPIMLQRGKSKDTERFDLFGQEVIHFIFSDAMKKRAKDVYEFSKNLILRIADPHDIIMMKCATERVKDLEDAKTILDQYPIKWDTIIKEAENQVHLGLTRAVFDLAGFIQDLQKKAGVKIEKEVVDRIFKLLEGQPASSSQQRTLQGF